MNSNQEVKTIIENTVNSCKDLETNELLAGLFILSKDYHEFLSENPEHDNKSFARIYSEYLYQDSFTFSRSPSFKPLEDVELPRGIIKRAVDNVIDLTELKDKDKIIHEWTIEPGTKLLEKFKRKFKDTICGDDGPYKRFEDGFIGKMELPAALVTSILASGFTVAGFWVPLAVYIALLLIKTGLKMYCED